MIANDARTRAGREATYLKLNRTPQPDQLWDDNRSGPWADGSRCPPRIRRPRRDNAIGSGHIRGPVAWQGPRANPALGARQTRFHPI
jgi:hypothetical protein